MTADRVTLAKSGRQNEVQGASISMLPRHSNDVTDQQSGGHSGTVTGAGGNQVSVLRRMRIYRMPCVLAASHRATVSKLAIVRAKTS